MNDVVRNRVRVEGVVQGVGFRPYVHSLATDLRLAGHVGNDVHGVFIEVEGPSDAVARFRSALGRGGPPLAVVERIEVRGIAPTGETSFRIVDSDGAGARTALVSADTATCEDCLRELRDPGDRRFGYPFVNCTHCGPRFTIVREVPYDRPGTTMSGFAMCPRCAREYHDPADRRFHAQPVCCPDCGPRPRLLDARGEIRPGDPLAGAAAALARGEVLAVKGLGGYHLAVDASDEDAAAALRARKHREDKPFALMVVDERQAAELCLLDEAERRLLGSRRRPVVLLDRRPDALVAPSVAPGNRQLGVLLPYTPLHHLLLAAFPRPIVLTSGNVSDEPIAHVDEDALRRLSGIADAFLTHDRPIHVRTDDSVVRVFRRRPLPVRRSRGYVPEPVTVPWEFPRPVLACGAELKNTFALARGRRVFVSQHIGDLENAATLRSFTEGIAHFRRLFDIAPEVVAHDLHPEYLSTKHALDLDEVDLVGVQHHHAHIASCLADNGEPGPVLGVAFDGLGLGTDGTIWGGEFLLADLADFRRLGHLAPVPLPGGTTAIRQPWRTAVSHLVSCGALREDLEVLRRNANWPDVAALVRDGRHAPLTSSAGRLFDAVAAVLGVRDVVSYEGQAAIELEQLADRSERGGYPVSVTGDDVLRVDGGDLVRGAVEDLDAGTPPATAAARFHNGLAAAVAEVCARLAGTTGVLAVALSGGVFQNMLLLQRTVALLERRGLRPLVHSRVPPNDGGISLGQAVVAGARDRR
ncbi:carbamoyltransferase HypF [Saccharopolyspora rosea]|uniref:carbamoyltransferase HypF n=1 Tax=Saccharopolyspora rosea TaxID=524884 RepID=UPI0021DB6CA2|nr:carbamoyltransferase HypF [Saccharopolyspora rosea]